MDAHFNLPAEAVEFLRRGQQLEYDASRCEPGDVGLHSFDELNLGEVWMRADDEDDPNRGEEGYYAIPAVSLTGRCRAYDPAYILLWLPEQQMFGTWDCDHWILTVFENAAWHDLIKNPVPYLDAQWNTRSEVGTRFQPWKFYQLKKGRPF